jgi:hypothetical protein
MAKRSRNAKGHFVKGGGRKSRSRALVRQGSRSPTRRRRRSGGGGVRRRSRRGGGGGGGVTAGKLAITALALGALLGDTSANATQTKAIEFVNKIPGAKTFGPVAVAGVALGAIGHFTSIGGARVRPWLKAAGAVGVIVAALKIGVENTGFKFVGAEDDDELMDVDAD